MSSVERRLAPWLDVVAELVRRPAGEFPHGMLARLLAQTFDEFVVWNSIGPDRPFAVHRHDGLSGWPGPELLDAWKRNAQEHPLLRWARCTGDHSAMTTGRVPDHMVTQRGRQLVEELLAPYGLDEQLAIPYVLRADGVQAFVVARTGADFADEDMQLARRLQPLFQLLDRQAAELAVAAGSGVLGGGLTGVGLTGRELAILRLLDHGLTAVAIGHRLAISPRTVHKHVENVYRKLGVTDRMMASHAAREAGLVGAVAPGARIRS